VRSADDVRRVAIKPHRQVSSRATSQTNKNVERKTTGTEKCRGRTMSDSKWGTAVFRNIHGGTATSAGNRKENGGCKTKKNKKKGAREDETARGSPRLKN